MPIPKQDVNLTALAAGLFLYIWDDIDDDNPTPEVIEKIGFVSLLWESATGLNGEEAVKYLTELAQADTPVWAKVQS